MGPVQIALLATAAFGLANLVAWMRGRRRWPLILAHLALGVGGAGALLLALYQSAAPADDPSRALARTALGLLVAAIVTGLTAGRLRSPAAANIALAAHMSCGVVGLFLALSLRGSL